MTKGSCLCGKTTFSYQSDQVLMTVVCHCLTCRKLSGTVMHMAAMVPESAFTLSSSKSRLTHGTHETGMEFEFYGCETCPSTLSKKAPSAYPGVVFVFLGHVDEEEAGVGKKPGAEMFTKYRVGWLNPLEGTVQFKEFPTQ